MHDSKHSELHGPDKTKESKKMGETSRCNKFSSNDYRHYVTGDMSLREMESLASHCEHCATCLREISKYHHEEIRKRELYEDNFLFSKTIDFIDSQKKKENFFDVIIKKVRNTWKIIAETGDILQPLQPVAARGDTAEQREAEPIKIIKEFSAPPLSAQITIAHDTSDIRLTISLFDPVKDNFCVGKAIVLIGPGIHKDLITDENGEVSCFLQQQGTYTVTIGEKSRQEAQIQLTFLK